MAVKNWVDYIIHSSLFVGFVGVAMVLTTSILFSIPIQLELLAVIFFISFATYNFNRSTDLDEDSISHPERTAFVTQYHKHLKLFATLSYVLGAGLAFFLHFTVGLLTLIPLIAVSLYSVPWIPNSSYDRLKEILVVKNVTVAASWAVVVTFLPLVYLQVGIETATGVVFAFIFLKVLGNTITFDIRDIEGDKSEGITTIPVTFGVEKTKHILTAINWTAFFVLVVSAFSGTLPNTAYFVAGVTLYTQIYIHMIGRTEMQYVADILADGEYIVMGILAVMGVAL